MSSNTAKGLFGQRIDHRVRLSRESESYSPGAESVYRVLAEGKTSGEAKVAA